MAPGSVIDQLNTALSKWFIWRLPFLLLAVCSSFSPVLPHPFTHPIRLSHLAGLLSMALSSNSLLSHMPSHLTHLNKRTDPEEHLSRPAKRRQITSSIEAAAQFAAVKAGWANNERHYLTPPCHVVYSGPDSGKSSRNAVVPAA